MTDSNIDDDFVFNAIETMDAVAVRKRVQIATSEIFSLVFGGEIHKAEMVWKRDQPNITDQEVIENLLRNKLIVLWHQSLKDEIDDVEFWSDQVFEVGDYLQRNGYLGDPYIALMRRFID